MSSPVEHDSLTTSGGTGAQAPEQRAAPRDASPAAARQNLELGRRIVAELGGDDASLLARWIAYRIAELIHAAESATDPAARREAEAACTELVLRAWQERSHWPDGWPPQSASEILEALRERPHWRSARLPDNATELTWSNTLPVALEFLDRERRLWILAALSEQAPDELSSWTNQEGARFDPEEEESLTTLQQAILTAPRELQSLLSDKPSYGSQLGRKGDTAQKSKTVPEALRATADERVKIAQLVATASAARPAPSESASSEE